MILHVEKNEMIIIHNSNGASGNSAMNYAAQEGFIVKEYDVAKKSLTTTQWLQVAAELGGVKNIINREHEIFESKYRYIGELNDQDWVLLLEHHPEILEEPIAITKDKVMKVYAPAEVAHM